MGLHKRALWADSSSRHCWSREHSYKKIKLGHKVAPGSSKYTNLSSHIGWKFFPRATLRSGSMSANAAKSTFGTIRVFGIIGRALPFAAVGLAVFDVISIGQCVYKK